MSEGDRSLCGPEELILKLLDGREAGRHAHPEIYGLLSDEGIRRLVMLSYFASQSAEEGRYPKFRLFVPPAGNLPPDLVGPWQFLRFTRPIPLTDVDDLRRLAPCAASHDFALEVSEHAIEPSKPLLSCMGVRMAHSGEGGTEILSISLWARRLQPGLMIRVDGPGELRVSEAGRALDLRAGKLVDLGGLPVHPLQSKFDVLSKKLAAPQERNESHISHTLHFAWNELVHMASEGGRGGCLVILPEVGVGEDEVESRFGIHLKYPTEGLMFGKEVAELVTVSRTNTTGFDIARYKEVAAVWARKKHALLLHVESLARLSGVDGCTVFDGDLRLLGFGGKISGQGNESSRRFRDARTNAWMSKDAMNRTGTRHLSAFRLCQAHEGVSCYVISQDGHVTLFWSTADTVSRWSPYWPWAKRSDHF